MTPAATPAATPTATATPSPIPPPPADPPPASPPDPAAIAPALDDGGTTSLADSTEFLYSGATPIQTGVAPGTIKPTLVGVLRGRTLDRGGLPLAGVTVSILDHVEYGTTVTRTDGGYDLAVNGGDPLTVVYARDGYLPLQRETPVGWQDFERLDDVVLSPLDPNGTRLTTGRRPGRTRDPHAGRRRRPSDDDAVQARHHDRARAPERSPPLDSGHRHGGTGDRVHRRRPRARRHAGDLPASSAYTYATELSVDAAIAAGADSVEFDKPVILYLENFLGMPVGSPVPAGGDYDRDRGAWVASENGRVVKIIGALDGRARLDVDGDGQVDLGEKLTALGIDDAELRKLNELYLPGQELWRTAVTHFTPWDLNWPYDLPPGAGPPTGGGPNGPGPDGPCGAAGSVIGCDSQTLGEHLAISGAPAELVYDSGTAPGASPRSTVTAE